MKEFEQNNQRLARNRTNGEGTLLSGAAREGLALLQGQLLCAKCGRALTVRYQGNGGIYPTYECGWMRRDGLATKNCLSVRAGLLDDAICEEMFKALKPAELELALAALANLEQRDQSIMRQWQMRIERAQYDCDLAQRRYEEVDPANRLVAASLENRWNTAMLNLEEIKAQATTFQGQKARVVSAEQKAKVLALARDLPRLWQAASTQAKDRKRMLRLLIADITVEKLPDKRQIILHIRWQGGACNDKTIDLPLSIADRLRYSPKIIERVRNLATQMSDALITKALNQEGLRNSRGLEFTVPMVKWIRYKHDIAPLNLIEPDEVTVQQLCQRLGVSLYVVHYWIKRGMVPARQIDGRGPWWIKLNEQTETELRSRVSNSAHLQRKQSNALQ